MIRKQNNTHFDVMTDCNIATTNRKIVQLELIQTFQYRDGNKGFVFYFLCEIEDEDGEQDE